jgi:hypothetical protein
MPQLQTAQWEAAYQSFIQDMTFARDDELISFATALEACKRLIALVESK